MTAFSSSSIFLPSGISSTWSRNSEIRCSICCSDSSDLNAGVDIRTSSAAFEFWRAFLTEGLEAFDTVFGGPQQPTQVVLQTQPVLQAKVEASIDRLAHVFDGQRRLAGKLLGHAECDVLKIGGRHHTVSQAYAMR